ncbi:helix-turn-helix domain-containing protein [Planctomicrobium sp. SH661]|uniref:helix-turn-helix domain-containing protein n=1 Tax=Planctomicrobium sp. SH661 TaxID=3448124 RepID=UPI003F5B3FCA
MRESPSPLALRPREAARMLSISERTLWSLTAPRGPIPCARLNRGVLYSVDDLRQWLREQSSVTVQKGGDAQ